ncbi:MAG: hypothetical protein L0154_14435 [Chloroflexi bacterium]|nr:hypothetical protein [Chloroflexota bacterium]
MEDTTVEAVDWFGLRKQEEKMRETVATIAGMSFVFVIFGLIGRVALDTLPPVKPDDYAFTLL